MSADAASATSAAAPTTTPTKPRQPHEVVRYHLASSTDKWGAGPVLDFVEDVGAFLARERAVAEVVIAEMQGLHQTFKSRMERLAAERNAAEEKTPSYEETLEMVRVLRRRLVEQAEPGVDVRYLLADGVWADAVIPSPEQSHAKLGGIEGGGVCLWLGSNTMMEFSYDEAEKLLTRTVETCRETVASRTEEMEFVKSQLTLLEVTISRFYNHDIRRRRLEAAAAAAAGTPGSGASSAAGGSVVA